MSRREFLAKAAAVGGTAVVASWAAPIIERAYAVDPGGAGSLDDIEHFVFLMQENRSFDHYFGTLSGVAGFNDPSSLFNQYGFTPGVGPTPTGYLNPFRLNTNQGPTLDGECINDPTHSWGPQHQCWNNGAMDQWVNVHLASEGAKNGPATMGYYTREDLPVHYALADTFTVCDHYHCSVLGPTDPNRLYWISAGIDPDGEHGGPLLDTPTFVPKNKYSWKTYPEALQEAGVTWKVYNNKEVPLVSSLVLDGMLQCFKNFHKSGTDLYKRGIAPSYPQSFRQDVKNGTLPSVSWVIPNLLQCEHPALPPALGAQGIVELLDILTSNPAVWEKTALIISYDENGGFFDHVTPPTPPPGTPGEFITAPLPKTASGIAGPIGLGFRVPALVISPYSRGGLVASETFDHTSQLRLIETRFGVEVPNLTAWRRSVTGDMTSTFNFAAMPDADSPALPNTSTRVVNALLECKVGVDALAGTFLGSLGLVSYPVPPNDMPVQESSPVRGQPSGPVAGTTGWTAAAEAGTPAAGEARTDTTAILVGPDPLPAGAGTPAAHSAAAAGGSVAGEAGIGGAGGLVAPRAPGSDPQPRTRVGAAVDSVREQKLATTGSNVQNALLAGTALIGAGAVIVAATAPKPAADQGEDGPAER